MSSLIVGFDPQIGHSGFLRNLSSRNFIRRASNTRRRPMSVSPLPRRSLIVSIAWIDPTMPGSTPSTPPSAHDGTRPGGGGRGARRAPEIGRHTSELQSLAYLVCRLLLEKKKNNRSARQSVLRLS